MRNPVTTSAFATADSRARRYQATQFMSSINAFSQLPADSGLEVALAGRSNAGKSSALNLLAGQRQLARVSKTPGRTQMINFFTVEAGRSLVDLPGYGYAQVPEAMRRHWGALLERYLRERVALRGLLLVMDIRHPLTPLDQQLLACCAARALPVHALLTKADKLSRGAAAATLRQVSQALRAAKTPASVQLFSAVTAQGLDPLYTQLDQWLGYYIPASPAAPLA